MSAKRVARLDERFSEAIAQCTKSDLQEILWVVMVQSPWFDEMSAMDDPAAVGEVIMRIRNQLREDEP